MAGSLFKVIRRIDKKEEALGKSDGGKRGWGDGQYYWVAPNSSRALLFHEPKAVELVKSLQQVKRYFASPDWGRRWDGTQEGLELMPEKAFVYRTQLAGDFRMESVDA